LKIIDMKEILYEKIQKELDERQIYATVEEVLENKPVFQLISEIYYNNDKTDDYDHSQRLPKLKYGKKKIHWDTLGYEVMSHEGFVIEIKIYDSCLYKLNKKYKKKIE